MVSHSPESVWDERGAKAPALEAQGLLPERKTGT